MRQLLGVWLMLLVATTTAQTSPHMTTASVVLSAIRIALNLGSGPQDYVQVEVVSEGRNIEQARLEGFRTAVSQAVGTVVATQTQSVDQKIVRDEIVAYSSGFVDRFEILEQTVVANGVRVRMRVWVAEIRLAHRLLGNSQDSRQIDGPRLGAQIGTIIQQRQSGDQLISAVMHDFPDRSFVVETGNSRVDIATNRQASIRVPVTVKWDRRWLDSLTETMQRTADPAKDWQVYNFVNSVNPVLRVSAMDMHGREILGQCYNLVMTRGQVSYNYPNRFAVDIQRDHLIIDRRWHINSSIVLPLGSDTATIERISQIQAKIVSQKTC